MGDNIIMVMYIRSAYNNELDILCGTYCKIQNEVRCKDDSVTVHSVPLKDLLCLHYCQSLEIAAMRTFKYMVGVNL